MPSDQEHDFQHIDINGQPVYYLISGTGKTTLLMIHGYPGRPQDFRWLNPPLNEDFQIIQIALPGMGYTPLSSCTAVVLSDRAAFLSSFLDDLGIQRCWVLGHSINGPLATALAEKDPLRIQRLILLCSIGLRPHRAYRQLPSHTMFKLFQLPGIRRWSIRWIRKAYTSNGFPKGIKDEAMLHAMRCAYALRFDELTDTAKRIHCPTMILWTDNDPLIEESVSEELSARLPKGPRRMISGGGHNPQRKHATVIAEDIIRWHREK